MISFGRIDAEAEVEAPILWPPDAKNWLIWKRPNAGRDWGQEEKRATEDEMVERHHWLNAREFVQALGVGDGHESLAGFSPWVCKESDMTEWLSWTELKRFIIINPLGGQLVKNLTAMQKTLVQFLGWQDPLQKRMATHSSILAWRIPWTEEPIRLQSMGSQRVRHHWATHFHTYPETILKSYY